MTKDVPVGELDDFRYQLEQPPMGETAASRHAKINTMSVGKSVAIGGEQ